MYAAYFRQIVDTMRAVPGASFRFDWSANNGSSYTASGGQLEAESAYPGDAYVDYIGLDVYDQSWAAWKADPAARWNEYLNARNGLRWHASFAAAHGKPMTFPEWGLAARADGNGGGDSPYFVEQMYWWLRAHDVAYHLYFESADPNGEYGIFSGRFPNAAARFVEYFGPNGPTEPPPPPPAATAPPATLAAPPPAGAGAPSAGAGAAAAGAAGAAAGSAAGDGVARRGGSGAGGSNAGPVAGDGSGPSDGADAAKLSIVRARCLGQPARVRPARADLPQGVGARGRHAARRRQAHAVCRRASTARAATSSCANG